VRSCAISSWIGGLAMGVVGVVLSCETGTDAKPAPSSAATPALEPVSTSAVAPSKADLVATLDTLLLQLEPCGQLSCATFEDSRTALGLLLDAQPSVLAVGEAHVMKGMDHVRSSTERFEQDFLPELAKHGTSELVVELLKPAPECEKPVESVKKQEKQVTEHQSTGNKNRFVSLGVAARERGIVPYLLEPGCPTYQEIANAGDDAVIRMLEVIGSETERRVRQFYERQEQRRKKGEAGALVVAYGGALHNDVDVEAGKEKFAFGKQLVELTGGRYLELDLIVPEFIQDNEVWRKQPWFASYDREHPKSEATLVRTGPRSFVLVFGRTEAPDTAPSASTTPATQQTQRRPED
jgi:hypothetical protein